MGKFKTILFLVAMVSLVSGAGADSITKPNTFTSGTTIKSSDVNANFDTVYDQVNKIGSVLNIDSTNNRVGLGTASPSTQIHIQNTLEAGIFLEADSGNSDAGENNHAFIKFTQDGGAIKGILGTVSTGDLDPENNTYTGAKDNAVLLGTSTVSGNNDGAIQFGTNDNVRMTITGTGDVGIGTTSPDSKLHVEGGDAGWPVRINGNNSLLLVSGEWNVPDTSRVAQISNGGGNNTEFVVLGNGNVGIGTISPSYPLHMSSGAHVTTGGVWTNASSREYKKDINDLSLESAKTVLEKLNPVTFTYKKEKDDQHVGFIAEDVPDLVSKKDRKGLSPMDIVAVVTKVVQDQQKVIKAQDETIQKQSKEIQTLKAILRQTLVGLSALNQKVAHLESVNEQSLLRQATLLEKAIIL